MGGSTGTQVRKPQVYHQQQAEPGAYLCILLVVGYSREDSEVHQVEEEVQKEHESRKLLPL